MSSELSDKTHDDNPYDKINIKIFQLTLGLYSVFSFIYYLLDYDFTKNLYLNLYNLIVIVPFFTFCSFFLVSKFRANFQLPRLIRNEQIVLVFSSLILLVFKYMYSIHFSTWGDEIYQAWFSGREVFEVSFEAQQPQIATFFNYFGQKLFGVGVFGIRSFNLLFHSILFIAFYNLLRGHGVSRFLSAIFTILLFFNPIIFRYGIEGRPYNYALVGAVFFLSSLKKVLASEVVKFADSVLLGATTTFLLLILSLQSVLFVFSLGLGVLLLYRKHSVIYATLSIVAGTIVALPVLTTVNSRNQSYLKNGLQWVLSDKTKDNINTIKYSYFYNSETLLKIFLAIGFMLILHSIYRRKKGAANWTLIFFLQAVTFVLAILIAFDVVILWPFSARYAILCALPLFLFISLIASKIEKILIAKHSVIFIRAFRLLILITLFAGIFSSRIGSPEKINSSFYVEDWMAPYKEISLQNSKNDIILTLCPNSYNCFHHPLLIQFAKILYPNSDIFQKNYYQQSLQLLSENKQNNIFLILEDKSQLDLSKTNQENVRLYNYYGIKLIVFTGPKAVDNLDSFLNVYKIRFQMLPIVDEVFLPVELAVQSSRKTVIDWKELSNRPYKSNYGYYKNQFFELSKEK